LAYASGRLVRQLRREGSTKDDALAQSRRARPRTPGLRLASAVALLVVAAAGVVVSASAGPRQTPRPDLPALPAGFHDAIVLRGLTRPTTVAFSRDGRIFVAEQRGTIQVYAGLRDRTPSLFANLAPDVNSMWERGLLGLALAPGFPRTPFVYVLYTRDALPGGRSPRWHSQCPSPPGMLVDGCVVTGRLARLRATGNVAVGKPKVLLQGWCQQFPTHSIGTVKFGPDGALYVSAGEGAAFLKPDWGQYGASIAASPTPRNPCHDPTMGSSTVERPPGAEGGSLRAQSLRRPAGQAVSLDGAIIRVDPETGDAPPDNPLARARSANARRIIAYGLRNPYRFTFRPGTDEIWTGDVGEFLWEEIDRVVPAPPGGPVPNFGWPCYEGPFSHPKFAKLTLCKTLPPKSVVYPYFAYNHWQHAVPNDHCSVTPGASITGLAFYTGSRYPAAYRNGLFFADYTRGCIWFMPAGKDGLPDPRRTSIFTTHAGSPVDLEVGPGGDVYYVDIESGTVHRIVYSPPTP
jgi:glucose/arabinose dehydrogenase